MQQQTEMTALASTGDWTLFERKRRKPGHAWLSLKLVTTGASRKKNFWLGWNGRRLARCHDLDHLTEHHAEVMQWVVDHLQAAG
ncbi:hypothetical protein QWJ07_32875 [Frankia sp. RB7]|nr:hypothetical protein [Frankia sp. RB7]